MEVDLSNKLQIIYILFFSPEIIYLYFNIFQKGKRASWLKGAFIPN